MSNSTFDLSTIAERYANAMIELAEQTNQLDKVYQDLMLVNNTIQSNNELSTFLTHPTIPVEEKKEIVERIFKDSVSNYTLNFLKLLLDRNRVFILSSIVSNYLAILNKKRNITVAQVITAIQIDGETINRVKEKLESLLNQQITVETKIDPEIVAGMIVKVGDRVIDGSIKTKLENMKKQLI